MSVTFEPRACPRDRKHNQVRSTTEVINGKTVVTKECAVCGQFITQAVVAGTRGR